MAYEILILSDVTHDLRLNEVMFSDMCNRIDICDSDTEHSTHKDAVTSSLTN